MKGKSPSAFIGMLLVMAWFPAVGLAETDGFRGIMWGADFKSLANMSYARTSDATGTMYFTRSSDELKYGRAIVNKIEYGFYNDKFREVSIEARGIDDCKAIKEASLAEFGTPTEELNRKLFKWVGEKTFRVYLERPDGSSCLLRMVSTLAMPDNPPAK